MNSLNDDEKKAISLAEPVSPEIFHIHIDTRDKDSEDGKGFHKWAHETIGFYPHDFTGHPDGYPHFEPDIHSTYKTAKKSEFDRVWDLIVAKSATFPNLKGYLEGEYIPTDERIAYKPVADFFPPPFQVETRLIRPGEGFRQTEFHLVMDFDHSDERVITALLESGIYGATLQKKDSKVIVLTTQGSHRIIEPLMKDLKKYLHDVGGAVRATLKEERAIRNHKMNIDESGLPEVAGRLIMMS